MGSLLCRLFALRAPGPVRHCPAFLLAAALVALALLAGPPRAVHAQDNLLFCNNPEQIRSSGALADANLKPGVTYTVFYHFKNLSGMSGPFVVALHGSAGGPLHFSARQGFADPQRDPTLAGRQAMARYLSGVDTAFTTRDGNAHFTYFLDGRAVASGLMTVCCDQPTRLRIYFRHDQWTVPHERVIALTAPRREGAIALKVSGDRQSFRIGDPEGEARRHIDGMYGMLYAFRIAAPPGRRVRVSFSPRGGKGGLVGSINGSMRQSEIVPATSWRVFSESIVGKRGGVNLTTAPFGGVFYPVELVFQLL